MAKRDSVKPAWSFEFTEAEYAEWWGLAACMDHPNADYWFAENVTDQAQQDAARNVCKVCPVQTKCLSYAMERPELEGMWGGLTRTDRRRARAVASGGEGSCRRGHDKATHARWLGGRWRCGGCVDLMHAARKARAASGRRAA